MLGMQGRALFRLVPRFRVQDLPPWTVLLEWCYRVHTVSCGKGICGQRCFDVRGVRSGPLEQHRLTIVVCRMPSGEVRTQELNRVLFVPTRHGSRGCWAAVHRAPLALTALLTTRTGAYSARKVLAFSVFVGLKSDNFVPFACLQAGTPTALVRLSACSAR